MPEEEAVEASQFSRLWSSIFYYFSLTHFPGTGYFRFHSHYKALFIIYSHDMANYYCISFPILNLHLMQFFKCISFYTHKRFALISQE